MTEPFDWPRIHKAEDHYIRQIDDDVWERVCEHFAVDDPADLTQEQIDEVDAFRNTLNEYSVLQCGFSNLISYWESTLDY